MCDCYGHKCELCDELVPMHIADFDYSRSRFRVWCGEHADQAPPDAVRFRWTAEGGGACAISGPNVGIELGNYPNIEDVEEE